MKVIKTLALLLFILGTTGASAQGVYIYKMERSKFSMLLK